MYKYLQHADYASSWKMVDFEEKGSAVSLGLDADVVYWSAGRVWGGVAHPKDV